MPETQILYEMVIHLAEKDLYEEVAALFVGQHPADLAEIISQAPEDFRSPLFDCVHEEDQPDVLTELEENDAEEAVVEALSDEQITDLVEEMSPDDAADLIADLDHDRSETILEMMEDEESEEVRDLLQYGEETAGGIMTSDLVALRGRLTLAEALDAIAHMEMDEPYYYVYTIDEAERLTGIIGLWDLLKVRDKTRLLKELVEGDIISVETSVDQEEVAHTMQKYDLTALPVVDTEGRLVGRVTSDDVMDVMEEEATEDILRMAGAEDSDLAFDSPLKASMVRLPWLMVTLGAGFIFSLIFKRYMVRFADLVVLSSLVPIVMGMSGNTGIQSATLIIRGMAVGAVQESNIRRMLRREVLAGLTMGAVCGSLMTLYTIVVSMLSPEVMPLPNLYIGLVAGLSLTCAMATAAIFGACVPVLFTRIKVDPAVASGPFITASIDILALLIYFLMSLGLVHLFGTM